jgi:hypothetical protein
MAESYLRDSRTWGFFILGGCVAKQKYEIIEINNVEITVDISKLIETEEMFFNATELSKSFDKRPDDFWKQKQNTEYLEALVTLCGGNKENYIRTKRGGKYQGTWFHKDLTLQFARWLSPIFAVKLDRWIIERIEQERNKQQTRLEAKTGFLPLTNAIMNAHDPVKHYHYSNVCNMINKIVLGMTAKQFREKHGVDNVRDNIDFEQLQDISELQRMAETLIKLGLNYQEQKEKIEEYYSAKKILRIE